MSYQEIRIECMSDILENIGISANESQITQIVQDFMHHIDMESEMKAYQYSSYKEECGRCKTLASEINELKKENDVFRNSVKQRRGASIVWIEGDSVFYEK